MSLFAVIIMNLTCVYRQLEEGASGSVVEGYTQQLQTQINKLKQILQVCGIGCCSQDGFI